MGQRKTQMKNSLHPLEELQATMLAVKLTATLVQQGISPLLAIHALISAAGACICQKEEVIVDSSMDTTHQMVDACIQIVRNNAVNQTTKPSDN